MRDVRSTRFSVRRMWLTISRTSQWSVVGGQRGVDGEHRLRVAARAQHDGADLGLVQAQPQQRVVELAEGAQRPGLIAGGEELVGRGRLRRVGRGDGQLAQRAWRGR